jgi:uncharacterized protein (TIGR01777 family)
MATVLITGGTGLLGKALTTQLISKGYNVIVLTRDASKTKNGNGISYAEWDVDKGIIDKEAVTKADYIIHLAGANVAEGRWTAQRKKEIIDSRVKSGALLVKTLQEMENNVKAVISSSAIGYYGPDPHIPNPTPFVETDAPSNIFLAQVCKQWEAAIEPVTRLNKRLVIFRIGIVLSNGGGAFAEFIKPLKFGTATVLGSGKQVVSWIHIDDIVQLMINAIENHDISGVLNAVAPQPVSNAHLIKTIAQHSGKKHITVPVPALALKLALGDMSIEILKSATVSSKKTEAAGFRFSYPDIDSAVKDLISRG